VAAVAVVKVVAVVPVDIELAHHSQYHQELIQLLLVLVVLRADHLLLDLQEWRVFLELLFPRAAVVAVAATQLLV